MAPKARTPWAGGWQVRRGPGLEGQEVSGNLGRVVGLCGCSEVRQQEEAGFISTAGENCFHSNLSFS